MIKSDEKIKALEDIRLKNGGVLRPVDVIEEASIESNPLHDYFEWDDSVAGHQFRLDQARKLIRRVRIKMEDTKTGETKSIRIYANLSETEETAQAYHFVPDVARDGTKRSQLTEQLWRELSSFKARFSDLIETINDPRVRKIFTLIEEIEKEAAA